MLEQVVEFSTKFLIFNKGFEPKKFETMGYPLGHLTFPYPITFFFRVSNPN